MKYTSKSLFKNVKYLSNEMNIKLNDELLEHVTCKIEETLIGIINDAKNIAHKYKKKLIQEEDVIKIVRYRGLPFNMKSKINDNDE